MKKDEPKVKVYGPNKEAVTQQQLDIDSKITDLMLESGATAWSCSVQVNEAVGCSVSGTLDRIEECVDASLASYYTLNEEVGTRWFAVDEVPMATIVHPREFTELEQVGDIFPSKVRINPDVFSLRSKYERTVSTEIASVMSVKMLLACVYEAHVSDTLNAHRLEPSMVDSDCDCPSCQLYRDSQTPMYPFVGKHGSWSAQLSMDLCHRALQYETGDIVGNCAVIASRNTSTQLLCYSSLLMRSLCYLALGYGGSLLVGILHSERYAVDVMKALREFTDQDKAREALSKLFDSEKEAMTALEAIKVR